jgi:Cys-tRNA(Pro)/Cys-tRNA(Cys) deacylase
MNKTNAMRLPDGAGIEYRRRNMNKTNAMRLLDGAGIEYRTKEYEYDENDLSGVHAAEAIGMPAEQVFKTLVTEGDKTGVNVFCIPVSEELDLKKAAVASGNKRVEMLPVKRLPDATGYVRGGCSPIGMKKKYPTFIDEQAILFDEIGVSAGARGRQVTLDPEALCDFIGAVFYDCTK